MWPVAGQATVILGGRWMGDLIGKLRLDDLVAASAKSAGLSAQKRGYCARMRLVAGDALTGRRWFVGRTAPRCRQLQVVALGAKRLRPLDQKAVLLRGVW
jgi:hypothetical protein